VPGRVRSRVTICGPAVAKELTDWLVVDGGMQRDADVT
jgi:hypothetical protein